MIRPCRPRWSFSNELLPDGNTFHELPFALTPGRADPNQAAAGGDRSGGRRRSRPGCRNSPAPRCSTSCCADRPRTRSGADLPRSGDAVDDITAALLDLDSSYVAVHGPPGTGKTYTAARVITRLVAEHGWRIGVVAQSHAVVENLLDCTIDAGIDPLRVAKKRYDRQDVRWQQISDNEYAGFIAGTGDQGDA